jgi:hypothetical protein
MSSPELNIKVRRVSHELTIVQYKSLEGVLWAHHSWILKFGGCPMSSPWFNTKVRRVSHELTTVQYKIPEGVLWAHHSWILNSEGVLWAHHSSILKYWGCPMSSWEFNIQLPRVSNKLMVVQYSILEDVQWAHGSSIFNCGGYLVRSWEFNIQLPRVFNEHRAVQIFNHGGCPISSLDTLQPIQSLCMYNMGKLMCTCYIDNVPADLSWQPHPQQIRWSPCILGVSQFILKGWLTTLNIVWSTIGFYSTCILWALN